VYPGATHNFDNDWTGVTHGHAVRSDARATADAERQVLTFLQQHLR
jgi:dienelactone hydrolase